VERGLPAADAAVAADELQLQRHSSSLRPPTGDIRPTWTSGQPK